MNGESAGDLIDYLLKREFGSLAPPPPPTLGDRSSFRSNDAGLMSYGQMQAKRSEYQAMSVDEIRKLSTDARRADAEVKAARLKREDAELFFNRPHASADLAYCAKMATWTLDEAVALSLGKAPGVVNRDSMEGERFNPEAWLYSPFRREYVRRCELVRRAHKAGELVEPTKPAAFLSWSLNMFDAVPAELIEQVRAMGKRIADLHVLTERVADLEAQLAAHGKSATARDLEKSLDARERTTLLTIIGALAEAANLGLSQHNKAGDAVAAMLDAKGVKLSGRTIGEHLKAVREAMDSRKVK